MMRALLLSLLASCVEVPGPLPIDGQMYLCSAIDTIDGHTAFQVERCGPWGDWRPAAEWFTDELEAAGLGGIYDADCRGTKRPCDYDQEDDDAGAR